MLAFVFVTILATAALLAALHRDSQIGVWLTKPVAAAGFIGTALAAGALDSGYGVTVLVALVLCMLGDVLLIPRDAPDIFRGGVLAFLLGHVAFTVAFVVRGIDPLASVVTLAIAALPVWWVLRWLRPSLPDDMRIPVLAYVVVITGMLVCAVGAVAAGGPLGIALGALMFYLSDLSVARDRFVAPGFVNASWGLPLYFGGQLVLAATVAS